MARLVVHVLNWKAFNPRKDVAASSWFRLGHDMLESDQFYSFTHSELIAWIYILCRASKENKDLVMIDLERAERVRGIKPKDMRSALDKLLEIQCVTVSGTETSRARDVEYTSTGTTDGRTDETKRTNGDFDFEAIYKKYPRKEGKTEGMKKCRKEIHTEGDYQDLDRAVDRFVKHHSAKGTEKTFFPFFSTFMTNWRDCLDPDYGSVRLGIASNPADIALREAERKQKQAEHDAAAAAELDRALAAKETETECPPEFRESIAKVLPSLFREMPKGRA